MTNKCPLTPVLHSVSTKFYASLSKPAILFYRQAEVSNSISPEYNDSLSVYQPQRADSPSYESSFIEFLLIAKERYIREFFFWVFEPMMLMGRSKIKLYSWSASILRLTGLLIAYETLHFCKLYTFYSNSDSLT